MEYDISEEIEQASGLEVLDKPTIERGLARLPSMIARQAQIVSEKRGDLDQAKIDLKVARAKEIIKESGAGTRITIIKDIVDSKLGDDHTKVITAHGKYEIENIELDKLENFYTSVRKQANILDTEMKTLSSSISKRKEN